MPDLSIVRYWICKDFHDWLCDRSGDRPACDWEEEACEGDVVDVPVDDDHPNGFACPQCGGEVISYAMGV